MSRIEDYPFPKGLHLLTQWQAGNEGAYKEMTAFFDDAIGAVSTPILLCSPHPIAFTQQRLFIC